MATTVLQDVCWTLIAQNQESDAQAKNLKQSLESKSDEVKIAAMKTLVGITLTGSDPKLSNEMMMHVIRFVLPSKNKTLKKLLLVYWEVCPKKNEDGKLKQEMILVCNYIRNDLQSPNEYVRAATLRLLCKLRETEILEPLVPSARSCLEHRNALVRKNAVFALYAVYKFNENLVPDASELIFNYLNQESDTNCKRNAFIALSNIDHVKALIYLNSVLGSVDTLDEYFQLAIIELIKKDNLLNSESRSSYIKAVLTLLETTVSSAVKFEAASALMTLTQSPAAIQAVGKCYVDLAQRESDNNVKLIVLERLGEIKAKYDYVLDDLAIDVLRLLSNADIAVCKKAVAVSLDLLTSKNIKEVISFLQKEVNKTQEPANKEKSAEYRQLLINAIHQCASKYPESSVEVVHLLMEYLGDQNPNAALDVINFVRDVIEKNELLRVDIVRKLFASFKDIKSGKVLRGCLWLISEYCSSTDLINEAFEVIRQNIGEVPILESEKRQAEASLIENTEQTETIVDKPKPITKTKVLADGTYATETVFSEISPNTLKNTVQALAKPQLRALIISGDYFLGAVLSTVFVRLILRLSKLGVSQALMNQYRAQSMLIMTSIIRVGQSDIVTAQIDEDSYSRILTCLKILSNLKQEQKLQKIILNHCHDIYTKIISVKDEKKKAQLRGSSNKTASNIDQTPIFRQLKAKTSQAAVANLYEQDIIKASGASEIKESSTNKLNRIIQLSGYSDPVYVEAFMDVHQYDIILDILIVNQTTETLQNVTLELTTCGDLKVIEKPAPYNMGPHSFHSVKASVKLSSTDGAIIFGNIVYDRKGYSDSDYIVLKDIHIDILDYISPADCSDSEFRSMWTEFEWENKLNINTNITDSKEFLEHVLKNTNMKCLTTERALSGDCGFLSANLYARTIFGEDALANISMERSQSGQVSGSIRIRSRTQGLALSLGDKITLTQKKKVQAV